MDSTRPRRWKLVIGVALAALLYWLAMFAATHLPIRTTPVGDPYSLDKLEHIAAFATLAALLAALGILLGIRGWKLAAGIIGFVALYALFDEATQSFTSNRSPEVLDWLADVVGAGLGIALFSLMRPLLASRAKLVAPPSQTNP